MDEYYKNKYLKYKQKYLQGGVCTNCAQVGFQQHHGECWHDAFSTIMLFSDNFSEGIQNIFSRNFDAATRITRVTSKSNTDSYPKYFLPLNIDSDEQFKKFCDFAKIYLSNLYKLYKNELTSPEKRIDAKNLSLTCVAQSYNVNNINRIEERKYYRYNHGGDFIDIIINACIYNYFLRESTAKYLILKFFNLREITKDKIKEILTLLPQSFGIYISLEPNDLTKRSSGHATGFFQCKNKEYFFDDNGISNDPTNNKTFVEFNWRTYLSEKLNILLTSDDVTYTIISDFMKGHGQPESTYGRRYLESYTITKLILFTTHEPSTEENYHKLNYDNYKHLLNSFSSQKITDTIIKYMSKDDLKDICILCVQNNNHDLLKQLKKIYNLKLKDYKTDKSLLGEAVINATKITEVMKILLEEDFDLTEILFPDDGYNLFHCAIEFNNIEFVNYLLLKNKSLLNSLTLKGENGLFIAIYQNNYDMVKLLLDKNININIKSNRRSPLVAAVQFNVYDEKEEYYQEYIVHGEPAKIFAKIENDENNFLESNKKIIEELLKKKDIFKSENISFLLFYAVEENNLAAVTLLFNKISNPDELIDGKTLLEYSIIYQNSFLNTYKSELRKELSDFILKRDMERNLAIVKKLLEKKLKPETIKNAKTLLVTQKKPSISNELGRRR